jgi:electron transport complex protein RnfC
MQTIHSKFRFHGGIHPRYDKEKSANRPLREIPVPAKLLVSLSQHLGAPAKPVVAVGDTVVGGQLIGEAAGTVSANVHAPVAGKIAAFATVPTAAGREAQAIVLEPDGTDAYDSGLPPMPDWEARDDPELLDRIGAGGVCGMGGAGFPTRVKLSPPPGKPIDTLILNGAECEPYLTCDHRMMAERAAEIWEGCLIARKILGAYRVAVAIETNKPEAIDAMEAAMKAKDIGEGAVLVKLPVRYPQGSEKQIIYTVTRRAVPAGGLPMDIGCVVDNPSTLYAIQQAVVHGRPLTHRAITVSGDAVAQPDNLVAPIGTTFADLADACGGAKGPIAKIIAGGPMMGFAQPSLDTPMTKTSSGLLLFSPRLVQQFTSQPCLSCGRCLDACPMKLSPSEMSQAIEADNISVAGELGVMNCFECGSCAYVCPASRPLVQHFRRAKVILENQRRAAQAAAKPPAKG